MASLQRKLVGRRIAPKLSGALFKLLHCHCGIRPNSKFLNSKEFIKGLHSSPSKRREEQFNLRSLESPVQMETVPSLLVLEFSTLDMERLARCEGRDISKLWCMLVLRVEWPETT